MATVLSTIITNVRTALQEPTAKFWTDAEILAQINHGIGDLWRALNALYEDYHLTVDATNCSIASGASTVTGVPSDVAVIRGLEPRVATSYPNLRFQFKKYNSPEFVDARTWPAQDPTQLSVVLVAIAGSSAPVGAPTLYVAPTLTAAVTLRLSYVATLPAKTSGDNNPIPGQSDKALECYAVAYCRQKLREDQSPDPDWLATYGTEKANLLVSLKPREEVDDEVVVGMFEELW